jgi:hypothetical protein
MIKIKQEKIPHYEGVSLFYNGVKVHKGTFVNISSLRAFWHKYMQLICAGHVINYPF